MRYKHVDVQRTLIVSALVSVNLSQNLTTRVTFNFTVWTLVRPLC